MQFTVLAWTKRGTKPCFVWEGRGAGQSNGGRTRSRVPQISWVITIFPIQFVGRFLALL